MKKSILIIVLFGLFYSCTKDDRLKIDVSKITSDVKINRFEKVFYTSDTLNLPEIKKEYRYFFPHDNDSIWKAKMKDNDEQELYAETIKAYPDLTNVKQNLDNLFKHVKYYYPKFKSPKVVTLISNISFDQKTVYVDSLLFISLDVFLGANNPVYESYPDYLKQNFTEKQMYVSVATQIANPIIFRNKERTFLSKMIQEGKRLYTLDAFLPDFDDVNKIGYTPKKLNWAAMNELMIWSFFIENELLYSTDSNLNKRFLSESPFSKFYLDIDNESPGKIGAWIGWQIVRSYMNNNKDVTLSTLMTTDNDIIFKKSKYKPKR